MIYLPSFPWRLYLPQSAVSCFPSPHTCGLQQTNHSDGPTLVLSFVHLLLLSLVFRDQWMPEASVV
jgi:hypothetical protein